MSSQKLAQHNIIDNKSNKLQSIKLEHITCLLAPFKPLSKISPVAAVSLPNNPRKIKVRFDSKTSRASQTESLIKRLSRIK